jgi:hypothetical protein
MNSGRFVQRGHSIATVAECGMIQAASEECDCTEDGGLMGADHNWPYSMVLQYSETPDAPKVPLKK